MSDSNKVDLGEFFYYRDRRLGMPGGQATVYVGEQKPPLPRPAAIKILHENHAAIPDLREGFLREAQCYAMLHHAYIVSVYGYGEPGGQPFIAMELVDGYDLRTWLRDKDRNHPIPYAVALLILRDVGRAIAHAHAANPPVAHRDLKPSNIMLSIQGEVKLTDFGLALVGDSQRTMSGELKGSPPYMSPEQTYRTKLDSLAAQRSDRFSLGVVAYELFSGSNPFLRQDAVTTMAAVRDHVPRPIGDVNPLLTKPFAQAIDRALDKDPTRREQDVEQFCDLIEDALDASEIGRQRNLLRSYMQDVEGASATPRNQPVAQHSEQARTASAGPARAQDATLKDERVLHGRPRNPETRSRPQALTSNRLEPDPTIRSEEHRRRRRRSRNPLVVVSASFLVALAVGVLWWVAYCRGLRRTDLDVDSSPRGASIVISGQAHGSTPSSIHGLKPGPARINLMLPGFSAVDDSITLVPGRQQFVRALARAEAPFRKTYLLITKPGFATVQIDGGPVHQNHRFDAELTSGRHEFRLVNSQLGVDRVLEYNVRAGDSAQRLFLDYSTGRVDPKP